MNIYDALYWLVTLIGLIAAVLFVTIAVVLFEHYRTTLPGVVHHWLDVNTDRYADYMEDEQERRTAQYHGDDDAFHARKWFGVRYLVVRRLFALRFAAMSALSRFQIRPVGEFDGQDWERI